MGIFNIGKNLQKSQGTPITEDWSESWSLEAGTLQVEMSIAICGQDGDRVVSVAQIPGEYGKEPCF
jgi:hypothetical protein